MPISTGNFTAGARLCSLGIAEGRAPAPDGGVLEYSVSGPADGPAVLTIHGVGVADALAPLQSDLAARGFRVILYHRRGYAGSSRATPPFTLADQAADAVAVLDAVGAGATHVLAHSYGGAVALQLALDAPDAVRSLALMEPALPGRPEQLPEGMLRAFDLYEQTGDGPGALDLFFAAAIGPDWRGIETAVPGAVAQAEADAHTLFAVENPALAQWDFGPHRADRISPPTLFLFGGASGDMARAQAEAFGQCSPRTQLAEIEGADHSTIVIDSATGSLTAEFFSRHST